MSDSCLLRYFSDDVFEDDTVEVTGLPLGTSSFENTEGGDTLVVVLAGCRVNNID